MLICYGRSDMHLTTTATHEYARRSVHARTDTLTYNGAPLSSERYPGAGTSAEGVHQKDYK